MSATSPAALHWPVPYSVDFNARRTASVHSLPIPARALDRRTAAAKDPLIYQLHQRLDEIAKLPENWDGYGSLPPDGSAVANARQFLEDLFQQTVAEIEDRGPAHWQPPHISASEHGEIVFEWWSGDRKLTVYIGREQPTYIKSWGPHVVNDMEDGMIYEGDVYSLWAWLFG